MINSKKWYQSVGVVAAMTIIVIAIKKFFSVDVTADEIIVLLAQGTELYEAGGTLVVGLLALWGRLRAKKQIQ